MSPTSPNHKVGHFDDRIYTKEEHHEWALHLWNRMDRDGSGSIARDELNCDEFQDVLKSVISPENTGEASHASYGRAEIHITQALDFCLRKATLNSDGTLSFKEFKSFMKVLRNQGDAHNRVHLMFALFDLDGSNTIDRDEFEGIYRFFCGHNPTHEEVETSFIQMDRFDKKEVTRNQFIRWLKHEAPPSFKHHAAGVEEDTSSQASSTIKKSSGLKIKKINRPAPGMYEPLPDSASTWSNSWQCQWNERFRGRDHSLYNPTAPNLLKHYFSAPQTLPELDRFYSTYRGFHVHRRALHKKEPPEPRPVLSSQSKTKEVNPERAAAGGTARNSKGDSILWDNEWPDKASDYKSRPKPGTLMLRCPGQPPPLLTQGRGSANEALARRMAMSRSSSAVMSRTS